MTDTVSPTTLTERQLQVLQLAADGHTDGSAGVELGLSAAAVGFHMKAAFDVLGVRGRTRAVRAAIDAGLVKVEPKIIGPRPALSPQQRQTLQFLARGLTNSEIAAELGVKRTTVRSLVTGVYRELGVKRRSAAVSVAAGLGLIDQEATP